MVKLLFSASSPFLPSLLLRQVTAANCFRQRPLITGQPRLKNPVTRLGCYVGV